MKKTGLQKRLITSILAVSFAAGLVVLILVYFTGRSTLKESIGATFRELAETVSSTIDLSIAYNIERAKLLASAQSILSAIEDSNLLYEGETNQEIEKRIQEIDARWTGGVGVNAYLFEVLNNRATNYLKELSASGERGIYNIILVTNEKGAVVGATEKPSHYSYISQKWWRSAYNNGVGGVYVSDIYFNEEFGVKTLDIATPVMKGGKATGVILMSHNVDVFFKFISATKVGTTDNVMLANSDGTILFSPPSGSKELQLDKGLLQDISKELSGWITTSADVTYRGRQSIVGYAPVKITAELGKENINGKRWYVFTNQDPSETFMPVYSLLLRIGIAGLAGAGLIAVLAYITAGKIVRPVKELQKGAEQMGGGDLDYRITVNTGDEIEDLASNFNDMASKLKLFYIKLEEMVKERTRELEQRNEEISILYSTATALNQSLDADKTFTESLKALIEVMKADAGVIWMLDNKLRRFAIVASHNIDLKPEREQKMTEIFEFIGDKIIHDGKLWASENITVDDRLENVNLPEEDFISIAGIPLKSKDKVVAIMFLLNKNIKALTSREEDMLLSIGSHIGIAVENSLLFAKLMRHDEPEING
ncbi:MAG TPA: cache domain-containing protein [Nitrospirota bacterium]|nr:cache domain-containing protein [Nitrospirota bacterium]